MNLQSETDTVKIYVRNFAKKACQLSVPPSVPLSAIKQMIYTKMKVPPFQQILYCHGRQLPSNKMISFHPFSIIHVVNKSRTDIPQITINIKKISEVPETISFSTSSSIQISQFYQTNITKAFENSVDWVLIYVGRKLDPGNTFGFEKVEDGSEVLLVQKNYRIDSLAFTGNIAERVTNKNSAQSHQLEGNRQNISMGKTLTYSQPLTTTLQVPQYKNSSDEPELSISREVEVSNKNAEHSISSFDPSNRNNIELASNQSILSNSQPDQMSQIKLQTKNGLMHTHSQPLIWQQSPQIHEAKQRQQLSIVEDINDQQSSDETEYQFTIYDFLMGNDFKPIRKNIKELKGASERVEDIMKQRPIKGSNSHFYEEIMKQRLEPIRKQKVKFNIQKGSNSEQFQDIMSKRLGYIIRQAAQKQDYQSRTRSDKSNEFQNLMRLRLGNIKRESDNPENQVTVQKIYIKQTKYVIKMSDGQDPELQQQNSEVKSQNLLSSIKPNSQFYNSSLYENSEQGASSINQQDYTFAFNNRNWSTQLENKQNTKFTTINGGTNIENWNQPEIDIPDDRISNKILDDSMPVEIDESVTGFFKPPSSFQGE